MNKMTIRDIPLTGRKVLLRVDFNVSVDAATGAWYNLDQDNVNAILEKQQ